MKVTVTVKNDAKGMYNFDANQKRRSNRNYGGPQNQNRIFI